jgi:hypothetical protein
MKIFFAKILMICFSIASFNNLNAQQAGSAGLSVLDQLTHASSAQSRRVSSSDLNFNGNGDSKEIMPGETLILADLEGPGIIKHIWNTTASLNPFSSNAVILRIYWDNAEKPSIEVPLGDFFGVGHGKNKDLESLPISVSSLGRSRSCFWDMPFKKHAKITLTNEMQGFGPFELYYYVDWEKVESLPKDILYFHARYNQQNRAASGDHTILNTTGKGNYVGTVYSVLQVVNGWFGEGDDRFYTDGEKHPSIQGTGTEDYFGDSWGFREFSSAYHGVSLYEGPLVGDRVSAYRWHLKDPIRFSKSLKFDIEHRGSVVDDDGTKHSSSNERADWISSVAFWYQTPAVYSDSKIAPLAQRTPPYQILLASALPMTATPNKFTKEPEGIRFAPETPAGEIEFTFELKLPGRYKFSAVLVDDLFGSQYQPMLDNQPAGAALNMLSKGGDWSEYVFGTFNLSSGSHKFKLKGQGASPNRSTLLKPQFAIGISSLILLRLEDI